MKISRKEQTESWSKWQAHIENISRNDEVTSQEVLYLEILFRTKDVIGYEKEQIRPDEMGKFDVFQALEEYCNELSHEKSLF